MVYIIRNPRDVCQSFIRHFQTIHNVECTIQDFANVMTNDVGMQFGPYFKHILGYWNQRSTHPNILFIYYEEMKRDLSGQIKRISEFLDIQVSEENLTALAKHFSFDSMKKAAEKILQEDNTKEKVLFIREFFICQKTIFQGLPNLFWQIWRVIY